MHDDTGYRNPPPAIAASPAWEATPPNSPLPRRHFAAGISRPPAWQQGAPDGVPTPGNVPIRQGTTRVDLRLPSDLDGLCAARLGDRLVRTLAADTGRIVLWISGGTVASTEAACLVNSLGRHIAREGRWWQVELRGEGPGFDALVAAYRQGLALPPAPRKA